MRQTNAFDQFLQFSAFVEERFRIAHGDADPMIRHAPLLEVVRADFLRPVARANLNAPLTLSRLEDLFPLPEIKFLTQLRGDFQGRVW